MKVSARDADWLTLVTEAVRDQGFAVVEGVLSSARLEILRSEMYRAQTLVEREVGLARLRQAGELGVLRLMMRHSQSFIDLLNLDEVLAVVDAIVSPTAILHLQNGFILPSLPPDGHKVVFQNTFHMDFPRVLQGYVASVNVFFAIDAFTSENGATLVVPGSHQQCVRPSNPYMDRVAVPAECPAGSMIVFDSTLWHAAGRNTSGRDRLAINHQFTRSFIKQQIDYVRALGDETVLRQEARVQQLLGWYTRVVTSLDEYYLPEDQRLYRKGQG